MLNLQDMLLDIANKVKDIAYRQGLIADYVVAMGGNNTCYYEKWASGKAVLYGLVPTSGLPVASGTNHIYKAITFPFTLIDVTSASAITTGGDVSDYGTVDIAIRNLAVTNASGCKLQIGLSSGLSRLYAGYEIIGTWK